MPIDYSKGDHFVDSDDEKQPPPTRSVILRIKPEGKQLELENVLYAGVTCGLLDIRDISNAAVTGIGYFVYVMTLSEFACWCPWHSRFHTMPILTKEHDPLKPLWLIQIFIFSCLVKPMGKNITEEMMI